MGTDAATTPDALTTADTSTADVSTADVSTDTPRGSECAQLIAVADPLFAPIDIIWAVDTSGSMNEEAALIETQLNDFVEFVEDSGLDVRVVMVAADTVCVPSPLSGGGCPDADSERYRHVVSTVGSTNALQVLENTYSQYSSFLRPEAYKHIVVVSDDESSTTPNDFRSAMAAVRLDFVFHAIVSLTGTNGMFSEGCEGPHGDAEAKGDRYILLSELTGGTASSICEPDWSATFTGIATNLIAGAVLPCEYGIPDIGTGREIVYSEVSVRLNGGRPITRHMDAEGCATSPGWYFDNNAAPTQVLLCQNVCRASGFDDVEVNIEFGCVKG